jgi:hypothetical protein
MVMHCDGTLVRVGEFRGQIWVTRRQNEPYHPVVSMLGIEAIMS